MFRCAIVVWGETGNVGVVAVVVVVGVVVVVVVVDGDARGCGSDPGAGRCWAESERGVAEPMSSGAHRLSYASWWKRTPFERTWRCFLIQDKIVGRLAGLGGDVDQRLEEGGACIARMNWCFTHTMDERRRDGRRGT